MDRVSQDLIVGVRKKVLTADLHSPALFIRGSGIPMNLRAETAGNALRKPHLCGYVRVHRGDRGTLQPMTDTRSPRLSAEQCDALSVRLRQELARRRMTRQALADAAKISISTLEKVLAGRRTFTLATIVRLEEGLGLNLLTAPKANGAAVVPVENAPDELGNYNRASVAWLEGSYLTVRPSFGEKNAVYAYRTDISWDEATARLVASVDAAPLG